MHKVCEICGRAPAMGRTIVRRGAAKRKGGAGRKVTGIGHRMIRPNLQRVRAIVDGAPRRIYVCASCLKAGKVVRAS